MPAPILDVRGLTKSFGGLAVAQDVSFTVPAGSLMGVMGPNGAGKTTLFNLITAVYRPSAGQVWFDGQEITGWAPFRISRAGLQRTWQSGRPFGNLTALQNVQVGLYFGRRGGPSPTVDEAFAALELVGLADAAERPARQLNVMQRKLLELARCVAARPRLLLLDEPLAGLNPADLDGAVAVIRRISARGVTVLWIEHIVRALIGACDRVLVLHHGERLAEGTPAEVTRDPAVIQAYLGERREPGGRTAPPGHGS